MPCLNFLLPEWPKRAQVTRSEGDLIGNFLQASLTENDDGERRTIKGKEGEESEHEGR